jgi:hypothetical protein
MSGLMKVTKLKEMDFAMKQIALYVFVLTTLFTVAFAKSSLANDEPAGSAKNDHFFALLAGSNLPGDNQAPLRYAHRDMNRIREVLLEIGKHTPNHIMHNFKKGLRPFRPKLT